MQYASKFVAILFLVGLLELAIIIILTKTPKVQKVQGHSETAIIDQKV